MGHRHIPSQQTRMGFDHSVFRAWSESRGPSSTLVDATAVYIHEIGVASTATASMDATETFYLMVNQ